MAINLKAPKGDTIVLDVTVVRDDVPVDLTNAEMWFTAKRKYTDLDDDAVIRLGTAGTTLTGVSITDAVNGKAVVDIPPDATDDLEAGTVTLLWDIQIEETGNVITTVASGRFALVDQVTISS